jgi:subtilase-type serine protease
MNKLMNVSCVSALALLTASQAHAGTLWIANLSGANENPPTGAPYTGTGFFILNDAETIGTVYATHNISIPVTGGHIHRGTATVNGPIIFPFPAPTSPVGPLSQTMAAIDIAALKTQGLYMNFHTAVNPGGAIRGTLNRVLLSSSATTASQMAVANALDVSAGLNADLDQVLMAQAVASSTVRAQALDEISGRTIYAQGRQSTETMSGFADTLFGHAQGAAAGEAGTGGFAMIGDSFGDRDGSSDQAGSKVSRPWVLAGFDFAPSDAVRAGLGVGYAKGRDKFDGGAGKTEAETTSLQAYVANSGSPLQVSAVAGYGKTKFDTTRALSSLGRVAASSHDGKVWSIGAQAAYPIAVSENATLAPYGRIDAQKATIDSYTETGAGSAGLVVGERSAKTTSLEAGVSYAVPVSAAMTARLQAGWRHAIDDDAGPISLNLIGSPIAFQTRVNSPGKDAAHLAASIGGNLSPNMTLSAGYRGLLSSDAKIQAVEIRLAMRM